MTRRESHSGKIGGKISGRILALAPLPAEKKAIASALSAMGHVAESRRIGSTEVLRFAQLNLELAIAGHGKAQFALQTQFYLQHLPNARAVICVGSAGSLTRVVGVADVVVAENTIEHDFRLRFIERPLPSFPADPKLLSSLRSMNPTKFPLHFGAIASGDEDIIDADRAAELYEKTGALAVAWEGAGGARACSFNQMPYLEIRGVTDTADHQAVGDFGRNLQTAMRNVAEVLVALSMN